MRCPGCEQEIHPVQEMVGGSRGMVDKCPRIECGAVIQKAASAPRRGPKVVPPVEAVNNPALPSDAVIINLPTAGMTTDQLLEAAKKRLDWVDTQLDLMAQLKAERAALRRMIGKK